MDLPIYVEPGKEGRCAWAMDSLKRSMHWDEERFGREYDLDVFNIVAVSDFNMGAMENKGLNIFNDALVLASPETATDSTFMGIERVIAHEYFHNWTGNRVTCRDWFQLCLKEGLTVFRDQEFGADERSATVQRINEVRQLKARQFPEDARSARPSRAPGPLHRDQQLLHGDRLREGRRGGAHAADPAGARRLPQGHRPLLRAARRAGGDGRGLRRLLRGGPRARDLSQFMTWYSQAGTPELVCQLKHDMRTKTAELTVSQVLAPTPGQVKKKPLHIPLQLGLLGGNGQELELKLASGERVQDGMLEVRKRTETFRFRDVASRPVPSLLRGFSAPVNLTHRSAPTPTCSS